MTRSHLKTTSSIPALMASAAIATLTASLALVAPASAGIKSISIEKVSTNLDASPAIVMKDSGSGYVLDKTEAAKIRMRIRAKADKKSGLNNVITVAEARLQNRLIYTLPINYRPVELDETIEATVGSSDLQAQISQAASSCNLGAEVGKVGKLPFSFAVRFQVWDLGPSETRSDVETFAGVIACGPRKAPKGPGDVAAAEPDFKVKDIGIRLLTTAGKPASPNPGTNCQETTARVRVATSKAGPVTFKLWSKIGAQPMQSQLVQAWSSFVGPGKFEAVFNKKINVDSSSQVQVMAEDLTNPIGQSTGWKLASLDCSGAGGGGLAGTPGNSHPDDPVAPALKVTGHLGLGEKPGAGKTKPRDATVVFRLWANKPGPTSYKLTCTGGHEWTGTVTTVRVAPGKYQGYGLKTVHIDKTTQLGCAVRSTSMPADPVVALATKQYAVVERNPATTGPDTVTTSPRPTHKPASRPEAGGKSTAPVVDVPKPRPAVRPQRQTADAGRSADAGRLSIGRAGLTRAATTEVPPKPRPTGGKGTFDVRKPH
jgi:hypothetical protein